MREDERREREGDTYNSEERREVAPGAMLDATKPERSSQDPGHTQDTVRHRYHKYGVNLMTGRRGETERVRWLAWLCKWENYLPLDCIESSSIRWRQ